MVISENDVAMVLAVEGAGAVRLDNAPFTMAAIAGAFTRLPPTIRRGLGFGPCSLIHSLNAGCDFQINKSGPAEQAVHHRVRVR